SPTRRSSDLFGAAIAFAGDELFIGEIVTSADPGGVVHVYRRSGNAWRSGATLKLDGANSGTRFGTSIATDGTTLLVGMRRGAPADAARGGVQVFTRGANGAWTDAGARGGAPAARSGLGAALH